MYLSRSWPALLAWLILPVPVMLAQSPYSAPPGGYPNPYGTPPAPNTASLGRTLSTAPDYAQGYNPLVNVPSSGPSYLPPSAYQGGQPFSLSTGGMGGAGFPGMGFGGYPMRGNSVGGALAGYGQALQGFSSTVAATGQYEKDIQTARIMREQSRQAILDTKRREMEYQIWYEQVRPKTSGMLRDERIGALEHARFDASNTEIWSGLTLNVLLKSVLMSPNPLAGPNIYLEENILRGLNLTSPATRGNLALAKEQSKIEWTETLLDKPYDGIRERFTKNFDAALKSTNEGEVPPRTLLNDLREDQKQLSDLLDNQVRDITPTAYIESRRLLNNFRDTIRGMSNAQVVRNSNSGWRRKVNTMADLVQYVQQNGLQFGPATAPGDYQSYNAMYYSLRAYERGIAQLAAR